MFAHSFNKLNFKSKTGIIGVAMNYKQAFQVTMSNYNEYGAQAVKNNGGYWLGNVINYGSPQWTANDGYIDFTLYTLSHAIRPIIYVDTSDICN